jgi:hypothetical protein
MLTSNLLLVFATDHNFAAQQLYINLPQTGHVHSVVEIAIFVDLQLGRVVVQLEFFMSRNLSENTMKF